jgi:hypothetical protein
MVTGIHTFLLSAQRDVMNEFPATSELVLRCASSSYMADCRRGVAAAVVCSSMLTSREVVFISRDCPSAFLSSASRVAKRAGRRIGR